MQRKTERVEWEAAHPPGADGTPVRLYTDEDPATTVKGMGFRDAAAARRTLSLATQPGITYKSYWSVRAMAERALRHPAQTTNIIAALAVFQAWLSERDARPPDTLSKEAMHEERRQRALLANSSANAHAFSRCADTNEFNAHALADRSDCKRRLAAAEAGRAFLLPASSVVAVFGGPARHGYGVHICVAARAEGLPAYRCLCGFGGTHALSVDDAAELPLGAAFRWPAFELLVHFDGAQTIATLTPRPPPNQPTLASFVRPLRASEAVKQPSGPPSGGVPHDLTSRPSPSCEALHVVLLRRDLRVDDQPALSRAAAAAAAVAGGRLLVCYVYDPSLLKHPTVSTAHFYFIDDCLAEVERELASRGSALVLRVGHLVGVLESFRRTTQSMTLWSNQVVGVALERERDWRTGEWCAARGVTWHDLPCNGVIPHDECASAWPSEEFQSFWSHVVEEHCNEAEAALPATVPPPPIGVSRGVRLSIDAVARCGASTAHGIERKRCLRGGGKAGRELLRTFLHERSYGYRSKLSSPVTADTACSRLSPHLAWGSLSLRHVYKALTARGAALHAEGGPRNQEWLVSIEGFRMRLHWRSHNMQVSALWTCP